MQKTGFLFISVAPQAASPSEPWRYAAFVKDIMIPELLTLYEHLNVVIGDKLQAHNIHEWCPIPDLEDSFVGNLFEQPTVLSSIGHALKATKDRGQEIEKDLNQFLDEHSSMANKITVTCWFDKDISGQIQSFTEELRNPQTEYMINLGKRIDQAAAERLRQVNKKYVLSTSAQEELVIESSKRYLIEEIVYFKSFLEHEEDAWYPGNFCGQHPLLLVCEKGGRQRFHRVDPMHCETAKLSIQKVRCKLEPKKLQIEPSNSDKLLAKIKKASNALTHLQRILIEILLDKGIHSTQADTSSVELFLDKLNDATRWQIKTLVASNKEKHPL